jgi:2-oxoglutarate dehydrogenase E2 component (dihydrolipoamide succinyltransferase)
MANVIIPNAGESVTTANVATWHVADGATVSKGDVLVTLETDKVSSEVEAEVSGVISIIVQQGEEVDIGTVIATISESANAPVSAAPGTISPEISAQPASVEPGPSAQAKVLDVIVPAAGESVTSANIATWHFESGHSVSKGSIIVTLDTDKVSSELEAEHDGMLEILVKAGEEVQIGAVIAKITVGAGSTPAAAPVASVAQAPIQSETKTAPAPVASPMPGKLKPDITAIPDASERSAKSQPVLEGRTTRRKMSMIRRKIASHLTNAQQTAAILTTFNEVDMTAIMKLRNDVQEGFVAKYGTKLGFMSFFVKASVQALKDVPQVNASIDGTDIIENHYYDISVAIGTPKGLVVPVLRDPQTKSFAQIEKDIIEYAVRARDGKITIEDLTGGVFTISNGGVYGSLLSTPIINPPQSAILGMHTIQQRPVAIDGKVEIRPMMNLALSYDHRLIDGKEAVTFLIRIKDCIENPSRLMLEM